MVCVFFFFVCVCLFCVCGEALKASRKLCHRQEQPEGCGSKYRKTRTFYHGVLVVIWFILSEGLWKVAQSIANMHTIEIVKGLESFFF